MSSMNIEMVEQIMDRQEKEKHTDFVLCLDDIFWAKLYFGWMKEHFGFGQFSLTFSPELGKFYCDDERIGRERIRKLLYAFADCVADNCVTESDDDKAAMNEYYELSERKRQEKIKQILDEGENDERS